MQTREIVNSWLQDIGKKLNTHLFLEDSGLCVLNWKDDVEIIIEVPEEGNRIYLYSPLLDLSRYDDKEKLFEMVLKSGFLGKETGCASFGIDEDNNYLMLWYSFLASTVDVIGFENVLGNFILMAYIWKKRLLEKDFSSENNTEELADFNLKV